MIWGGKKLFVFFYKKVFT